MEKDKDDEVRAMAAFAIGEIESIKSADAILNILNDTKINESIRARAVEAAGKIAAANPKDGKSKLLGEVILDVLNIEFELGKKQNRETILLGLTAILRVRPEGGDLIVGKFLTNSDARIRTDAGNTLVRLRSKNFGDIFLALLMTDTEPMVRANAARALGISEDKATFIVLLDKATKDKDSRVRVSAIRSLGSLKNAEAVEDLIKTGEKLFADYKKSKFANPSEKNELLEIATTLSRILPNTNNEKAVKFLQDFRQADKFTSPEIEIALAKIAPKTYVETLSKENFGKDWRTHSAAYQGLGEIANLESNAENNELKSKVRILFVQIIGEWISFDAKEKTADKMNLSIPDLLRAFAAFKSENTSGILRPMLETEEDLFIRAAIAEILGEQSASKENTETLKISFEKSLKTDKDSNDAQFAILSALVKLDKLNAIPSLKLALDAPDFLVRRLAVNLIKQNDLAEKFPNYEAKAATLKLYAAKTGTKQGQILNTNADYTRAVSRKNGTVKAIFETEKGTFTINLMPEDAPLTVDNFIKLAQKNYFNGLEVHRVVPNFVMQDGDPRGDGNGGPG
ncbi:MAG TPA: HEAT repeat domain-containing protein, partial [Pyrinomonadaceae bacterium]|nr:HEAT repeat domain-containing protein [Pyrinomonadaceae bacterium]